MGKVSESVLRLFVARSLGERDSSIDALRGLAIFGMILVNHVPPTPEVYAPFKHALWTGWTVADTIFPIFLFLVGASIGYSQDKSCSESLSRRQLRIVRRTALLIIINIALINFPYYELEKLVVYGTLSKIAVCYLVVALLGLHVRWRWQLLVLGGILIVQWYLLGKYDVPVFGRDFFTVEGNALVHLDKSIFGDSAKRIFSNVPTVQVLLSVVGSIASTLFGALAGRWIIVFPRSMKTQLACFGTGVLLFAAGMFLGQYYSISKPLWTGSYVIMMGGLSLLVLALIDWALPVRPFRLIGKVLQIAGVNALFLYVFAQSLQRILVYGRVTNEDGSTTRFRYLIHESLIEPYFSGKLGALLYSLVFLSICYTVVLVLYKRRIFIKL